MRSMGRGGFLKTLMIADADKPVLSKADGSKACPEQSRWVEGMESLSLLTKEPSEKELSLILKDAYSLKGLNLESAALLLAIKDARLLKMLFKAAGEIKEKVFGKRIVLFAPLYLSNLCVNGCLYCGFRSANKDVPRKALSTEEVVREAAALEGMGFKRILLVTGEDP